MKIPSNISELASEELHRLLNDHRVTIFKIYKGKEALNKIKELFFKDDKIGAEKWSLNTELSSYEKSQGIFVIFSYNTPKRKSMHFIYVVGKPFSGSILGEKWDYDKGMKQLKLWTK